MSIREQYLQEIKEELSRSAATEGVLLQEDIESLPLLMRRYLEQSGHIGKPKALNCFVLYDHASIKMKPERGWLSMDCQQFNSSATTTRIALMRSRLFGVVPFSGKDKYQHGQGNMLIKLAGFTVSDAKGPEMNKAALVTYLAESVLLPSAVLDKSIKWQEIDNHTLKGSISHAGLSVSGLFCFNDQYEVIEFQTEDRYYSPGDGTYRRTGWSANLRDYKMLNGYKVPEFLSATWHLPEGDYEYFRGTIKEVQYGVKTIPQI